MWLHGASGCVEATVLEPCFSKAMSIESRASRAWRGVRRVHGGERRGGARGTDVYDLRS